MIGRPTPGAALERYVSAGELALLMGVSTSTVKRWVTDGCPSETWGMRVRRFRVSEVVAWRRDADTLPKQPPRPAALERRRARSQEEIAHG